MALIYDSDKIRAAARQVSRVSDRLQAEALNGLKRAGEETENLNGEAAKALEDSIGKLRREIAQIDSGIEEIAQLLLSFAARLDAADEKMAQLIQ